MEWQIWQTVSPAGLVIDHNLIDAYKGSPNEVRGTNPVEGDPRFVDRSRCDVHLLPDSPAINAGASTVNPPVADDVEGNVRPQGSGFDMGAYEFGTAAPDASAPDASTLDAESPPDGEWQRRQRQRLRVPVGVHHVFWRMAGRAACRDAAGAKAQEFKAVCGQVDVLARSKCGLPP